MSTRKTSVAVDEQLAFQAQQALGTSTLRETIEHAFLEVIRARARREDLDALSVMAGLDLADVDIMRHAWDPEAAERAGMGVLHYDAGFDRIAAVTGQPTEWVVPRGSVP